MSLCKVVGDQDVVCDHGAAQPSLLCLRAPKDSYVPDAHAGKGLSVTGSWEQVGATALGAGVGMFANGESILELAVYLSLMHEHTHVGLEAPVAWGLGNAF